MHQETCVMNPRTSEQKGPLDIMVKSSPFEGGANRGSGWGRAVLSETQQVSGRAGGRPRILASHLALSILAFGPEGQAPCPWLPMQGCGAFSSSQALPTSSPAGTCLTPS